MINKKQCRQNYRRQTTPHGLYTMYTHGTPHDILSPLMFSRDLHMSVWPIHSSMRLRASHLVVPRRVYDRLAPTSPFLSLYIGTVIIHTAGEQVTHACASE